MNHARSLGRIGARLWPWPMITPWRLKSRQRAAWGAYEDLIRPDGHEAIAANTPGSRQNRGWVDDGELAGEDDRGWWLDHRRKCKKWPIGCRWIEQAESVGGGYHDGRFFTKRLGGCVTVAQGESLVEARAAEGTARRCVQVETAGRGTRKTFAVAAVVW